MPKIPKVWGSTELVRYGMGGGYNHDTARVIIKAVTKKRAMELANSCWILRGGMTRHRFAQHWGPTGNPVELEVTSQEEEGVWYRPEESGVKLFEDYKKDKGKNEQPR